MADIVTLQSDLERLKAARRSGTHSVRVENREVYFRNDSEIAAAIAATEREIAAAQGDAPIRNVIVRSKGWS